MLALYRCGRQAEALEVYRDAREVLADELGLEPSPAPQELERAILRQDPASRSGRRPTRSTRPLPVPPTPLVGRRLELAAVERSVPRRGRAARHAHRPGRHGKTRLGLAVAHALEPELRDGALFVSLAPVSTRSCSCPRSRRRSACAKARRPLAEGVIEHLRERRMLLVLDNFEQLLAAAPFVGDLLAAAPRLWILATSRAPLRLAAEHEYPVPPFDSPTPACRSRRSSRPTRCGSSPRVRRRSIPASSSTRPAHRRSRASAPGSTDCRSRSSSPRRARSSLRRRRSSSGSNASRTSSRPARATRPPASARSPPRSAGATTCSVPTSASPSCASASSSAAARSRPPRGVRDVTLETPRRRSSTTTSCGGATPAS